MIELLIMFARTVTYVLGIMVVILLVTMFVRDHTNWTKRKEPVQVIEQPNTTPAAPLYILKPEHSA